MSLDTEQFRFDDLTRTGRARNSPYASLNSRDPRQVGMTITILTVSQLIRWLAKMGIESTFYMERVGDRNRVALRITLPDCIVEREAAWLYALQQQRLDAAEIRRQLAGVAVSVR